jgi:SanA protein
MTELEQHQEPKRRRMRSIFRWRTLAIFAGAFVIATSAMVAEVQLRYAAKIASTSASAGPAPVAIVLGASVKPDGTPSDALRDRILTGVDLFKAGRVERLLMTGDDGRFHVDEVDAMKKTAVDAGVPENAIDVDGRGYRTYESCKRAHDEFKITDAVVVTQRFHLGRALYLCNELGINASGAIADRQTYVKNTQFWIRDLLSSAKAFWDIHIHRPASPVGN